MDEQDSAGPEAGRGQAMETRSSVGFWESSVQKILGEEDTLRSEVQSQQFREFCYLEANGPREGKDPFAEMGPDSSSASSERRMLARPPHPSLHPAGGEAAAEEPDQGLVCFEDVTVRFTEEEWALLDPDQRALHKEVTEENRGILASLSGDELEMKNHRIHDKIHTVKNPYQNVECGESSHSSSHPRNPIGKKTYQCLECGKTFHQRSHLTAHQRIHTGEKPYQCLECGKSFNMKQNLTTHQRIHKGEKPYQCLECGKRFSTKAYVTSHQKIHTREKPYQCWECGKSFDWKYNLTSHQR
ncbi:zinc finger protein 805-like, partial [Lacerta agilis]|uniref:zinc finger protein 805-like n=1 Tax=Lacerta agilis TaxID=80427 RepID=UPI00141A2AA3